MLNRSSIRNFKLDHYRQKPALQCRETAARSHAPAAQAPLETRGTGAAAGGRAVIFSAR